MPSALWEWPTSPEIAHHILMLLPLEKASLPELLNVIRWDPAISLRILAAANASPRGQTSPALSLPQARLLLNDLTIQLLALQFTLDSLSPENAPDRLAYETFWLQSRIHAVTVSLLAEENSAQDEVDPFLAGLFLASNRLALLKSNPKRFRSIEDIVIQTARPWCDVERELQEMPVEHPLVQAGFPADFVDAVRAYQLLFPQRLNSRWGQRLAVAEAMADLLVLSERNPERSGEWLDRLTVQHTNFVAENEAADASIESLIDRVRCRLEQWLPSLEKHIDPLPLMNRANREVGRLGWQAGQTLEQSKRKISWLKRQALRDPLTGVYNRRFLWETLQKEAARCCRHANPIGLLFVDVDEFKSLNDAWGHLVGDRVLRQVAETLSGQLPPRTFWPALGARNSWCFRMTRPKRASCSWPSDCAGPWSGWKSRWRIAGFP